MAGVNKNRTGDADVYEATETIKGGQLVVPAAGATNSGVQGIAVAASGAANVLGVAARLAQPTPNPVTAGTDSDGYDVLAVSPVNELTTVYKHAVVDVTYAAAAVGYGDKLVADDAGGVRKYDPTVSPGHEDTADMIVGECRVVGGMGAGGGTGKALIY